MSNQEFFLSDFISVKHGFAFKGDFITTEKNENCLLTPGNFMIGGGFKSDKFKYFSGDIPQDYILKEDDLIITMTDLSKQGDTLGYSALVPSIYGKKMLHNQRIGLVEFKNNELDKHYLYFLLRSHEYRNYILGCSTGSTVRHTSPSKIVSFKFVKPDLETQKKIASKLLSLEKKIELNTQINQTLEQIAQALFKSWFVDFDPVRAKVQALSDGMSLEQAELAAMQAISGKTPEELTALSQAQPERYAELTETAKAFPCEMVVVDGVEVPKGWEVKELGSLMTIKRGGSPRPIKDFISDKGLNWVKISDATAEDNPFLFSTKEYIKSEGLSKTVLLKKGSLILSNSATPGLPRFLELDACIHDGWLYFSDIKSLTQEYLYFFFLNIRNDLVAQGNGSVFTNLKTDIVKAQKAIVPDERVICYFDKQVKSIMNLIRYNTANSISLKETRDLLLPRLLNGEING